MLLDQGQLCIIEVLGHIGDDTGHDGSGDTKPFLPAAVSQTVNLSWCSDPEDNPLASADYRIKLTTEGRASRPLELFIRVSGQSLLAL